MNIIEKFILGKDDGICGDLVIITENFISVIDVNTSKSPQSFSGANYINTYKQIIEHILSVIDPSAEPNLLFSRISEAIRKTYISSGVERLFMHHPINRFSASMMVYSSYYKEVWSVGDCQCRYNHKTYVCHKQIDIFLSDIRSAFLDMDIINGRSITELRIHDTGRDYIYPLLCNQYLYQTISDHPFSYRVIDGFEVPDKFINRFHVSGDILIMASDGYPLLFDTLAETESYLRVQLEEDPLFIRKHKSTKGYYIGNQSFDDRAYIKIKIE